MDRLSPREVGASLSVVAEMAELALGKYLANDQASLGSIKAATQPQCGFCARN